MDHRTNKERQWDIAANTFGGLLEAVKGLARSRRLMEQRLAASLRCPCCLLQGFSPEPGKIVLCRQLIVRIVNRLNPGQGDDIALLRDSYGLSIMSLEHWQRILDDRREVQ